MKNFDSSSIFFDNAINDIQECLELTEKALFNLTADPNAAESKLNTLKTKLTVLQNTLSSNRNNYSTSQKNTDTLQCIQLASDSHVYASINDDGKAITPYFCPNCFESGMNKILYPTGEEKVFKNTICNIYVCSHCHYTAFEDTGEKSMLYTVITV